MKTGLLLLSFSSVFLQPVLAGLPLPADPYFSRESFTPSDPWQWPFTGTSMPSQEQGNINLLEAWTRATGSGIKIGIVDDGLATDHPDLAADTALDHDWNDDTPDDASPSVLNRSGTGRAGLAAAQRNNRFGTTGVAPDAGVVGLRLTAGPVDDAKTAEAIAWRNDVIHIKSCDWKTVDDVPVTPGPLALAAFADAAVSGRGGKGTVFVWAGGRPFAYNGYSSDIHGIAVAASTDTDLPYFSLPGSASTLISAPVGAGYIISTGLPTLGYLTLQGWSPAYPMVAGTAALMLERNPNLGWRDVQEILIRSARRHESTWPANGAGLMFDPRYGAGILDSLAAVELAGRWENLPAGTTVSLTAGGAPLPIPEGQAAGAERTLDFSTQPALRVEHVQVTVNATHPSRAELRWVLISPSGMESLLAPSMGWPVVANLTNWNFSSVFHWGESSSGVWRVKAVDEMNPSGLPAGTMGDITVTIHGTPLTAPAAAPVVDGPFTAEARMEEAFCYFIKGSHRPASYAATGLPAGFSIDTVTGKISGRPSATGVWPVNISAANSQGTGTGTLTITVSPRQLRLPVITSAASVEGIRTSPFLYRVRSSAATAVSVSGLPAGLTFSSGTREITGTLDAAGTFNVTLSASNADGTANAPLTITVVEPAASPLVDALDLPGAAWTTTGAGYWTRTTAYTHDGVDAVMITGTETGVPAGLRGTFEGPGELIFWYNWMSSSAGTVGTVSCWRNGEMRPCFNDAQAARGTWVKCALPLPNGSHVVEFPRASFNFNDASSTLIDEVQFLPYTSPGGALEQPAAAFTMNGMWAGQTGVNFDGTDAVGALATGTAGTRWLQTTLTGHGEVVFRWKRERDGNQLSFSVDGQNVANTGSGEEWTACSKILTAGPHTLRWEVTEGMYMAPYAPLGWVDNVQLLPVLSVEEGVDTTGRTWTQGGVTGWASQRVNTTDGTDAAISPIAPAGQYTSLSTDVTGPAEVQFSWNGGNQNTARVDDVIQRRRVPVSAWTRESVYVPAGTHTVTFRADGGGLLLDEVTILLAGGMAEALDTSLHVTTPAAGGWYPQSITTHDGTDAVTASSPAAGQRAEMSAQVSGAAGVLRYWWKYQKRNESMDRLEVLVDGVFFSAINTNTDWTLVEIPLSAGIHTIAWALGPHPVFPSAIPASLVWVDGLSFTPHSSELAEGVDTTGQTWTGAGSVTFYTQTAVSHDGTDAVQAGTVPAGQTAGIASEFTGPGTLTFWWKVNSWEGNPFTMTLDGYAQTEIKGAQDWTQGSIVIGPGTHTAAWLFQRVDASNVAGGEGAWLDEVVFTPGPVLTVAEAVDAPEELFGFAGGQWEGQTSESFDGVDAAVSPAGVGARTMFAMIYGPGRLDWRWKTSAPAGNVRYYVNDNILASKQIPAGEGWQQGSLVLDAGPNKISWRLSAGNSAHRLWMDDIHIESEGHIPLAEALDTENGLAWTTTGPAWFGQSGDTWDGTDAAKSPLYAILGIPELSASVTGPALLSFRWKSTLAGEYERLVFHVDGVARESIKGPLPWTPRVMVIDPGVHTISWKVMYVPAAGQPVSGAWDRGGLVDAVSVEPVPPPGFGDGIDQPLLTWTTSGNAAWFAQSAEGCDGTDVVTSPVLATGQTAEFFTTVDGPALVSFYAKMSDASQSRRLTMTVDGVEVMPQQTGFDWRQFRFLLPSGSHELRWTLTRPFSNANPDNPPGRAWVDRLEIQPALTHTLGEALNAPQLVWSSTGAGWFPQTMYSTDGLAAAAVVTQGQQADLLATVAGPGILTFRLPQISPGLTPAMSFSMDGLSVPAPGATAQTLYVSPGTHSLRWRVTGPAGTRREAAVDQVSWTPSGTAAFAVAADFAGAWSASASPAGQWFGQTGVSRDGTGAIQSAVPTGANPSELSLTVNGPGVLSFWTMGGGTSSAATALYVDGAFNRNVAGSAAWTQTFVVIAAGSHTVTWQPNSNMWEAVWLDSVAFTPTTAVPVADALDGGPPLTVSTTTGTWTGQTAITHDGTDALQSPAPNSGEAKLTATVTGPAVLTYWFRWPSAINSGGDGFTVWVDGNSWDRHEPSPDWQQGLILVQSGTHTVEWRTFESKGLLWLDEFTVQPVPATTFADALDHPGLTWNTTATPPWQAIGSVAGYPDFAVTPLCTASQSLSLASNAVQGPGTLQFRWRKQRNTIDQTYQLVSGAATLADNGTGTWETRSIPLPPGSIPLQWNYSTAAGLVTQQEHRAWLEGVSFVTDTPVSLTEAGDTGLILTPSPASSWVGYQSAQAADGTDCIFVSDVPASGFASLAAVVEGPGFISFSSVMGEYFRTTDFLMFSVDGNPRGSTSQTFWRHVGYDIPAGTHQLLWTMVRGTGGNASTSARLDRITWQPGVTFSSAANSGAIALTGPAWSPLPLPGASHGLVAASPVLTVNTSAHLTTTLSGAGTLTFSWYREPTASPPFLSLMRNGNPIASLTSSGVWQRTTVILAPGTHNLAWQVEIPPGFPIDSGRCFIDDITFIQGGTTGYNTWAAGWFSPEQLADQNVSGPLADPDNDGHTNLHELGFGGNPFVPGETPTGEWMITAGVRAYAFRRLPAWSGVVTLTPQYSTDLTTWTDAVSEVVLDDGVTEYLRAFIPANEETVFFRVKASMVP